MSKLFKKFVSVAISLLIILGFIPPKVEAADGDYYYQVWVNGQRLTSSNMSGNGWSFSNNASWGTLSLNGFHGDTISGNFGSVADPDSTFALSILYINLTGANYANSISGSGFRQSGQGMAITSSDGTGSCVVNSVGVIGGALALNNITCTADYIGAINGIAGIVNSTITTSGTTTDGILANNLNISGNSTVNASSSNNAAINANNITVADDSTSIISAQTSNGPAAISSQSITLPNGYYVLEPFNGSIGSASGITSTVLNPDGTVAKSVVIGPGYNITAQANTGGTVSGGGAYGKNNAAIVTAIPNSGYRFVNWTEDDDVVSTDASYSFVATKDRNLVANFEIQNYNISASANPAGGGTVSGVGAYGAGSTATVTATANEHFDFVNWTEDNTVLSTNPTYSFTATSDRNLVANFKLKSYTINASATPPEGGSVSGSNTYSYGLPVTLKATPSTGYNFVNWTENGQVVSTNAIYLFAATENRNLVANFEKQKYTVDFVNYDNALLESKQVDYGQTPEYTGATPTKPADAQYTYNFAAWTPSIVPVTTAATYTATYSSTVNEYTIKFVNEDGTELQSGSVAYGTTPTYTGATPTKPATAQYTYTFAGWSPTITSVTGDKTYTATYNSTVNEYTIKFVNEDGTQLQSGSVAYGVTPEYTGATPTKPADAQYTYTFAGWDPAITSVTGNKTYTATYSSTINEYPLWVGGIHVTGANMNDILEDGTCSYDPTSNTLTLNNANITGYYTLSNNKYSIYYNDDSADFKIVLQGTNTLGNENNQATHGIYTKCSSLNINGSGNLNIKSSSAGIYNNYNGSLSITDDANITITNASNGIMSGSQTGDSNATITISNSSVTINGASSYGLNSKSSINIENSPVTINSTNGYGINSGSSINVENSDVTVNSSNNSYGVYSGSYINIENSSFTATGARYYGIHSNSYVSIGNSSVNVTTAGFYAIYASSYVAVSGDSTVSSEGGSCSVYATRGITLNDGLAVVEPIGGYVQEDIIYNANGSQAAKAVITTPTQHQINISANPIAGGTVSGSDTYNYNTSATLTATPNEHYHFVNWTENGEAVSTDAEYTFYVTGDRNLVANFELDTHTIKFVNEDGTELQSSSVAYGETPSYSGQTPTKPADAQYTYTFNGWDPAITSVTGDKTYTATYSSTVNEYTIKFVNEDGTELQSGSVAYGVTPEYTGATPTKAATAQYTYTFNGWDPAITSVTGDKTYTATYNSTVNEYTITANITPTEGGTVTGTGTYDYGTQVNLTATPSTGYHFVDWTENGNPISTDSTYTFTITDNRTLVANFEKETYPISITPTEGGTVTGTGTYDYGSQVTLTATPITGYRFVGWIEGDDVVSTDPTYTFIATSTRSLVANFSNKYTITFQNDDGTVLESKQVDYEEIPEYTGATPTKPADDQYTYTFAGWDPEIVPATDDATYTAVYSAETRTDNSESEGDPDDVTPISDDEEEKTAQETKKTENSNALDELQTGDETNIHLWLIVMLASSMGLVLILIFRKKYGLSFKNYR